MRKKNFTNDLSPFNLHLGPSCHSIHTVSISNELLWYLGNIGNGIGIVWNSHIKHSFLIIVRKNRRLNAQLVTTWKLRVQSGGDKLM